MLLPSLMMPEAAAKSVEAEAAVAREDVWFYHLNPLKPGDPLAKIRPGSIRAGSDPMFLGERLIGTLTIAKRGWGSVYRCSGEKAAQVSGILCDSDSELALHGSRRCIPVSRELEIAKTIQR